MNEGLKVEIIQLSYAKKNNNYKKGNQKKKNNKQWPENDRMYDFDG